MPLFARGFQELMTEAINDLAQNTNITRLSPGGFARAILESVNKRIADAYEVFDLNLARAFVSSAPGQFLELIGALLGVTRIASNAASTDQDSEIIKFYVSTGTFGDINNGNDIFIPQGTLLSTEENSGGTVYKTTAEYTALANQSAIWVAAEATLPGEDSNIGDRSLVHHSFNAYTDSDNETLLVTNIHPIANGKNIESDANFRFRIVNRVLEAEAANLTAIRLAVLTTPGVADAILVPRYKGIGTLGVILKATLPVVSQSLIDNVSANVQQVQALGDIAYIRKPKETGLTMKTTIHYDQRLPEDDLELIEDTIIETITNYVNDLDIGEELVVNRLVAELFAVDSHIANIGISGKPLEEVYIHTESRLQDNKVRQTLLGDYTPDTDERVIIEPSVETPITLARDYQRR
jgi:uncharacterized phage protein gp47/JayE